MKCEKMHEHQILLKSDMSTALTCIWLKMIDLTLGVRFSSFTLA